MRPYIVAVTGASGVVYAIRLIQILKSIGHSIVLVISENARCVFREEMGLWMDDATAPERMAKLVGEEGIENIVMYHPRDLTAPIASGSYPIEGMIIIPCSMGTLGAIATGTNQNLIHRAADCVIKEGKKLVLVPRETPLSAIHLENMLKLSRIGVRIVPAMPAFYSAPKNLTDLIDFVVGKVLDQVGIEHFLFPRWTGPAGKVLERSKPTL